MKNSAQILVTVLFILFTTLVLPSQNTIIGLSESGPAGSDYSGGMIWSCSADGSVFKPLIKFTSLSIGQNPTIVFQGSTGMIYGVLTFIK